MQNEVLRHKLEEAITSATEGPTKANDPVRDIIGDLGTQTGNASRRHSVGIPPQRTDPPEIVRQAQSSEIERILEARQDTHGDFTDNARVMQGLKRVLWNEKGWDKLTDVQREALEMIVHKCGRIISGNPNEPDHWNDIAGYAKLAAQRIK